MSGSNTPDNAGSPVPMPPSPLRDQLTEEELQNKIDMYSSKIEEFEYDKTSNEKGKEKASSPSSKRQKRIGSRHERNVLNTMLEIEECSNIKGEVFGLVDGENNPMTGSSDSLREWWKEGVNFTKSAPAQIEHYNIENSLPSYAEQGRAEERTTAELLMELPDPLLGSILSLLVQHCHPPQKHFTYEKDPLPPWWPTGKEPWWGQTGIQENEGPPPFKRPHDLKKKWKVAVIMGIIKLMAPKFVNVYNVTKQSEYVSTHMNVKEWRFWTLALVAEARRYCLEHPGVSSDEAVAFLLAYGSRSN